MNTTGRKRYRVKKQIHDLDSNQTEPEAKKPRCPIHKIQMSFSTSKMVWVCTEEGCKQVAIPEVEVGAGKPIVGDGEIHLVKLKDNDGNDVYMIRCLKNNVFIDISDLLTQIDPVSTEGATVTLSFPKYTRLGN